MYQEMTFTNILNRTLSGVSDDFDKRQGAIIYDALAPLSVELAQFYRELDRVLTEGFADTASRTYLVKRAKERGLYPFDATSSVILASLTGNISLNGGERFSTEEGIIFFFTGEMYDEFYKLQAETVGDETNISYGDLLPIDNIPNLTDARINSIFLSGSDEEDTEVFRKRYFDSLNNQAFGGNRADYIAKINELNELQEIINNGGIGGVKVYRVAEGGGKVDVYITNNSYSVPIDELVSLVQELIDPTDETGEGVGIAPIGHFVTIKPVNSLPIDISIQVDLKAGYVLDDLRNYIESALENYISDLCKTWQDDTLILRISYIESIVLDIIGVLDVRNTTINGFAQNIILDENTVAVRGDINAY